MGNNPEKQTVIIDDFPGFEDVFFQFGQRRDFRRKRVHRIKDANARKLALSLLNRLNERKIVKRWKDQLFWPITYVNVPRPVCEILVALQGATLTDNELQKLRRKRPDMILKLLGVRKLIL